jgi:hypothetical protein
VAGDPPLVPFALFLGTALAVTAVPVLARIVEERRMAGRSAARIALAAAGAQELAVWPALAVAVAGTSSSRPAAVVLLAGLASLGAVVALARLAGAVGTRAPGPVAGAAVLVCSGSPPRRRSSPACTCSSGRCSSASCCRRQAATRPWSCSTPGRFGSREPSASRCSSRCPR